jgi:acetoin utilization protein AcuB
MTLETLISTAIPTVNPLTAAQDALDQMETLHLSHLPYIIGSKFQGFVSEDMLLDLVDLESTLDILPLTCSQCYIIVGQHPMDILSVAETSSSTVVAVLDEEKNYIGSISVLDLAYQMGREYHNESQGDSLVISLFQRDYSLAEVARLVESNGVTLLHSYVDIDPTDSTKLLLTLKLSTTEMGRVVATLERFGFHITQKFGKSELPDLDMERLGSLLRYLNI